LLGVSVNTVRTHLKAVYRRLGVASRVELAQALSQ
jgi:DNA-binding CsgD family transcriptional regulator